MKSGDVCVCKACLEKGVHGIICWCFVILETIYRDSDLTDKFWNVRIWKQIVNIRKGVYSKQETSFFCYVSQSKLAKATAVELLEI